MSDLREPALLAIDPGNIESAYVAIDSDYRPQRFAKVANELLVEQLYFDLPMSVPVAIEMVAHYGTGMPAGKTVFDTCVWIGRFLEAVRGGDRCDLVLRASIKTHHCGNPKAKDGNIIQALIDRFAPDQTNYGKGTKAEPGWFHGFRRDVWQAYALAVYQLDQKGAT